MSELKRIRWLCRRGRKELDVLLDRFVNAEYDTLNQAEHDELLALLNREDPDLWYLLMGRMPADNDTQSALLSRMREFEIRQSGV